MSANGISNLATKELKQVAKLDIAQAKREGRVVAYNGSISGSIDSSKNYYRERNQYDLAESSTYDVPSFQPARVVSNDVEVLLQGDIPNPYGRGHNMVVLDRYGDVVTAATQYDTYIDPANLTTLASALGAVASGNIVVLVVYDASALNAGVRSAINTGYGSTNTNTWTADRKSHIFIGIKT